LAIAGEFFTGWMLLCCQISSVKALRGMLISLVDITVFHMHC